MSLASMTFPAVSLTQIRAYAEASGDFNKIHLDHAFAREAGLPDVIAHGMLSMGLVAEALLRWGLLASDLVDYEAKFKDILPLGSSLRVEVDSISDDQKTWNLRAIRDDEKEILTATAVLKNPARPKL